MFLISHADLLSAQSLRRSGELSKKEEGPEPDSLSLMDSVLGQFRGSSHWIEGLTYDPVLSQVPVLSSSSVLRAVGGATYRARYERQVSNVPLGRAPLLDRLAQGLIRKAFGHRSVLETFVSLNAPKLNLRGKRQPRELVTLDELFSSLNTVSHWNSAHSESWRERKLGLLVSGVWLTLTVRANVDEAGTPSEISLMELSESKKIPASVSLRLESALSSAVEDQQRRTALADAYGAAPLAPALPPELRASLKRELELIGIPNGSYSREGFSSGRFPYDHTTTALKGLRIAADRLIFYRCSCGAVKSVTINSEERGKTVLRSFSRDHIEPWHSSICPLVKREKIDERFEPLWNGF